MQYTPCAANTLIESVIKIARLRAYKNSNDATIALAVYLNTQGLDAQIEMRWMQYFSFTGQTIPNRPLVALHIPDLDIYRDLAGERDWQAIFAKKKERITKESPHAYKDFTLLNAHKTMNGNALKFEINLNQSIGITTIVERIHQCQNEIDNAMMQAHTPDVPRHHKTPRI